VWLNVYLLSGVQVKIDVGLLLAALATLVAFVTFGLTVYQEHRFTKASKRYAKELDKIQESAASQASDFMERTVFVDTVFDKSFIHANPPLSVFGDEVDVSTFRPFSQNWALNFVFASNRLAEGGKAHLPEDVIQPFSSRQYGAIASIVGTLKSRQTVPQST
jgi:hypothetical protein